MENAQNAATDILIKYWDRELPIIPSKVINSFISERESKFCNDLSVLVSHTIDPATAAYVFYDRETTKFTIGVNANMDTFRIKFTLAHAFGHYILGHGDCYDSMVAIFGKVPPNYKEQQANVFAMQLLLPYNHIFDMVLASRENDTELNLHEIAKYYDVPMELVLSRITQANHQINDIEQQQIALEQEQQELERAKEQVKLKRQQLGFK